MQFSTKFIYNFLIPWLYEEKLSTLEEAQADEMEVAAQEDEGAQEIKDQEEGLNITA